MTERAKRRMGLAVIVAALIMLAGALADRHLPWSAAGVSVVAFLLLCFAPFLTEDE
jgi:hypothetical protein